jgi:hypothetical protein
MDRWPKPNEVSRVVITRRGAMPAQIRTRADWRAIPIRSSRGAVGR